MNTPSAECDAGWLQHRDDMIVLMPPGWAKSWGVRMQIEAVERLGTFLSCVESPAAFAGLSI